MLKTTPKILVNLRDLKKEYLLFPNNIILLFIPKIIIFRNPLYYF